MSHAGPIRMDVPGAIRAGAPGFPRPGRECNVVGQAQVGAQRCDLALAALLRLLGRLQGQPLLRPPALTLQPAARCHGRLHTSMHACLLPVPLLSLPALHSCPDSRNEGFRRAHEVICGLKYIVPVLYGDRCLVGSINAATTDQVAGQVEPQRLLQALVHSTWGLRAYLAASAASAFCLAAAGSLSTVISAL